MKWSTSEKYLTEALSGKEQPTQYKYVWNGEWHLKENPEESDRKTTICLLFTKEESLSEVITCFPMA